MIVSPFLSFLYPQIAMILLTNPQCGKVKDKNGRDVSGEFELVGDRCRKKV